MIRAGQTLYSVLTYPTLGPVTAIFIKKAEWKRSKLCGRLLHLTTGEGKTYRWNPESPKFLAIDHFLFSTRSAAERYIALSPKRKTVLYISTPNGGISNVVAKALEEAGRKHGYEFLPYTPDEYDELYEKRLRDICELPVKEIPGNNIDCKRLLITDRRSEKQRMKLEGRGINYRR